jgi:hypothetical protein
MNSKCLIDYTKLEGDSVVTKYESFYKIMDSMRHGVQNIVCGKVAFDWVCTLALATYPTSAIVGDITYFLQDGMDDNYFLIPGQQMVIELAGL